MVAVRESHEPDTVRDHGEAVNELVAVPLDGSAARDRTRVVVLVSGPDFVSSPRVRDQRLAWTQWNHPRMPFDGTELWTGEIERAADGTPTALTAPRKIAGGPDESVVQPEFGPDGRLMFCSDRSGWWNLWRETARRPRGGVARRRRDRRAAVGLRRPVVCPNRHRNDPDRIVASIVRSGLTGLCIVDEADGRRIDVESPLTAVEQVVATEDGSHDVVIVGATPTTELAPIRCRFAADGTVDLVTLRPGRDLERQYGIGTGYFSRPEPISFDSAGGRTAHGLWYEPTNPDVTAPPGELPPLLVLSHGGPTAAARARLDLVGPVLDQPRVRGGRRELRGLDRLRPPVP